jgi:hypothetical protein
MTRDFEMTQPLRTLIVPLPDLIRMVAPRLLNADPSLSALRWTIDVSLVPGQGIKIDVIGLAEG